MKEQSPLSYFTQLTSLCLGFLFCFLSLPAFAASKYWDTIDANGALNSGTGVWDTGSTALWNTSSTGANTPLVTWADNDDAFFQTGGTNVVTLSGTINANSVTMGSATKTTLNGGTLILNGASGFTDLTADSSTMTVNSAVVLGAAQAWQTSNGTTLTLNGNVTGTFALSLSNGGSGGQGRQIIFNGMNSSFTSLASVNGSSTARTVFLNGSMTLTGTLSQNGTSAGLLFSGGNNSFGGISNSSVTMSLGGTNAVTGTVTISSGGTLVINSMAAIGGTSGTLSVGTSNGAIIRILGTSFTSFGSKNVVLSTANGDNETWDIADAANTFTFDKNVTFGSNSFNKEGRGTMVLVKNNTGTGTYVAKGGILQVDANSGGALAATAKLGLSGGIFLLTGTNGGITTQTIGAVTANAFGGTIKVDGGTSTATTLNMGAITASAAGSSLNFVTTGSTTPVITTTTNKDATGIYGGRILFNGSDWATTSSVATPFTLSAYSGYTALNTTAGSTDTANSLLTASSNITGSGTLGTNTLKIANSGTGTLDLGSGNTLALTAGGLLFTGSADYQISSGTLVSTISGTSDLIVHQNGSGTLTVSSVIANGNGVSTLTKTGTGKLVLATNNTYTGQTYINGGVISGTDFSGTASIFGGAAATTQVNINGGGLEYTGVTDTTSRTMAIGSNGATLDITTAGVALSWTGVISDSTVGGSLTKKGAGTLILTTASNTFTGGLFIDAGIVQVGNAGSLNSATPNIVTFTASSTGILRLNGLSITVGGLQTNATPGSTFVENNSSGTAATLTVNSTFATTYGGSIRNGAAATLSLVKTGGNVFTLSGSNSYTGTTVVNAGTLVVTGSISGSVGTTVTTARLLGTGLIANSLTVGNGVGPAGSAVLQPGLLSSVGTLTAGTVALNSDAAFKFTLNSTGGGAGSGSSELIASSLAINSGAQFVFSDLASSPGVLNADGSVVFTVIQTTGGITGTFANLANGSRINDGTNIYQAGYDSNTLKFTVVPEPGTWAMLAGGLGMLIVGRRLRRRDSVK